jgi:hypothetical protein
MKSTLFKERLVDEGFWALVLVVTAVIVAVFIFHLQTPIDGYKKRYSSRGPIVESRAIPEAGGLQEGDLIISIGGARLPRPPRLGAALAELKSKPDSAIYEVERRGKIIAVKVPLHYIGPGHLIYFGGANFLLAVCFLVLALALYLRSGPLPIRAASKAPKYKSVRIMCYAMVLAAANIISVTDLSGMSMAQWVDLIGTLGIPARTFTFALLLHFSLIFPPRQNFFSRKWWAKYALHGSHLMLSVPATLFNLVVGEHPVVLFRARVALACSFIICSIAAIFRSYRAAASPVERNQLRWLAWGAAIGIGPWLVFKAVMEYLFGLRSVIDYRLLLLFTLLVPISIFMAISRYKLLEIDGLIRRSLVYTVLMVVLTDFYLISFILINWLLQVSSLEANQTMVALTSAALMVLAFNPLKMASERLIGLIFYRRASDPRESFARLSMTISQALRLPQLMELLTINVPRAFLSSGAALLVINGDEGFDAFASSDELRRSATSSAEELIRRVRSNPILWPEVIYPAAEDYDSPKLELSEEFALCFPMSVRGRLVGIYLFAEKLSGKLYSAEELKALRTLAQVAATALDNAQAYESLSRLNAELEELVKLRTAELQRANLELGHKNEELLKRNEELERLIAELRETQAALVEAERRAAIGEIIVTICHEINNPLTAIIGQAQLIQLHAESLPGPVLDKIKTIDQCADRIRDITEKMRRLTTTKTTTYVGQIKMIDLNQQEGGASQEAKSPARKATASRSNLPD